MCVCVCVCGACFFFKLKMKHRGGESLSSLLPNHGAKVEGIISPVIVTCTQRGSWGGKVFFFFLGVNQSE